MKINQLILLILDWPCDQFDKFRDWLEKGAAP